MARLALFNLMIGFWLLFLAAAAGAFIASDLTAGYLKDKALLDSWLMMLTKSAHGHTNLFALVHITFGLTYPYSIWGGRIKLAQTIGLLLGSLAMAAGLLVRGYQGPREGLDVVEVVIGLMLSAALAAMFTHAAGLTGKWLRHH